MPSSCPAEERFPLLLLFLEDGQRASRHNKRIVFDKSRYQGITSGASAIMTQWPGHLTTCWLTATLVGLTIILLSMMLFALSMHPGIHLLTARCKSNHMYDKTNETATIHLVHGPRPWMQSQLDTLEQIAQNYPQSKIQVIIIQPETSFVENTQKTEPNQAKNFAGDYKEYEDSMVPSPRKAEMSTEAVSLAPTAASEKTSTLKHLKRIKRIKRFLMHKNSTSSRFPFYPWEKYQLNINIGAKNLLKMLLQGRSAGNALNKRQAKKQVTKQTTQAPKIRTIDEMIRKYPKVRVINSTYERIFRHSPLYFHWQNTNEATRLFAIRVLQIWNFAGIAFDLPEFPGNGNGGEGAPKSQTDNVKSNGSSTQPGENFRKFKKLITVGLSSFDSLPRGLVTVDDEGLHMETKTTCHAFFGEILMGLRSATRITTPAAVIRRALQAFCKRGAVDAEYCQKIAS